MEIQSLRTNDCIDEVIQEYSAMVYRISLTHVKTKTDADDVFQEVFMRYFRKDRTFRSEEHRRAWLIRVTINCSKKLLSSAWRKRTVQLDDVYSFEMPEENSLYRSLLELPEKYRSVLHLYYFEDMSVEQVGQTLNIKPATVRMQMTRGRTMMKEKLKGDYFDE